MTKRKAIILGFFTILSFLFSIFYRFSIFTSIIIIDLNSYNSIHLIHGVIMIVFLIIYIKDTFKNIHESEKTSWLLILYVGNLITMPIYWYINIWKPIKKEDKMALKMEFLGIIMVCFLFSSCINKKPDIEKVEMEEFVDNDISIEDESGILTIDYNNLLRGKNHLDYDYTAEDYARNGAVLNIIKSGGRTWTVRHLVGELSLQGWREDVVDIFDNPRGNIIYRIIKKPWPVYDFVFLLAITKEEDTVEGIELEGIPYKDHWVKILIDYDKSGWIFGQKLDVERGGGKYLTPENVEDAVLEGSSPWMDKYYVKENVMY